MRQTYDALMAAAGCAKWPSRWQEFYDTVMDDFDTNGCEWIDPARYARLARDYDILVTHLALYQKAARAVAQNESLSRILALLCHALSDRDNFPADLKEFQFPQSTDKRPDLAYDMLPALALCSTIAYSYQKLRRYGLPAEHITYTLRAHERVVDIYKDRQNGRPGHHLFDWCQLYVDCRLFRIGRLEIELFRKFRPKAKVFRHLTTDETVILADGLTLHRDGHALGAAGYTDETGAWVADIEETENLWRGYPADAYGRIRRESVTLAKDEWRLALQTDDPVVGLHIPADGPLKPEMVDQTLQNAKTFLQTYFNDYPYRCFTCNSWLLDPQLVDLLGENANISKFCKRFHAITAKSSGEAIFYFVYKKMGKIGVDFTLDTLPENTDLERALKAHYSAGKFIYELPGVLF